MAGDVILAFVKETMCQQIEHYSRGEELGERDSM